MLVAWVGLAGVRWVPGSREPGESEAGMRRIKRGGRCLASESHAERVRDLRGDRRGCRPPRGAPKCRARDKFRGRASEMASILSGFSRCGNLRRAESVTGRRRGSRRGRFGHVPFSPRCLRREPPLRFRSPAMRPFSPAAARARVPPAANARRLFLPVARLGPRFGGRDWSRRRARKEARRRNASKKHDAPGPRGAAIRHGLRHVAGQIRGMTGSSLRRPSCQDGGRTPRRQRACLPGGRSR